VYGPTFMSGLPQFGLPRFFAIIPSDARKCYLDAKPLLKSAYFLYFISGDLGKLQIEAAQVLAKAIRLLLTVSRPRDWWKNMRPASDHDRRRATAWNRGPRQNRSHGGRKRRVCD
jgi:hypothetical protein